MSELNFLAFCITVIAITAIVYGKDKIAEKAVSALSHTVGDLISSIEKGWGQAKARRNSNTLKTTGKPKQDE